MQQQNQDDDDDDQRSTIFRQTHPRLRPNSQELTLEEIEQAKMVKAAHEILPEYGLDAAQNYLDGHLREPGWMIDAAASEKGPGLVVRKDGNIRVLYGGTRISNPSHLLSDATIPFGKEHMTPHFKRAVSQMKVVIAQNNGVLPERLGGYSLGGGTALYVGDMFKIPTTTYNPFFGKSQIGSTSKVQHNIIRTIEDFASIGTAFTKGKRNFNVKAIDPIEGNGDPNSQHKLENFTKTGNRQPGGVERLMYEFNRANGRKGHLSTVDEFKTSFEEGLSFTEALQKFNGTQQIDVTPDGKLGSRINKEAASVRIWRLLGGAFTESESNHIENAPSFAPRNAEDIQIMKDAGVAHDVTDAEIKYFADKTKEERLQSLQREDAKVADTTKRIDEHVAPHKMAIRAMMPKTGSLARGFASAIAAHALMEQIDPDHKIPKLAEEAAEGGLSGAITVMSAASMGAEAALAPEIVAGAAGYIAGIESAEAITKALEKAGLNKNTSEAIGDTSGGLIGGVASSAAFSATSIVGAMALGSSIGEAVGALGGPAGILLGMAAGAAIGTVIGALSFAFSDHHEPTAEEVSGQRDDDFKANSKAYHELTTNTQEFTGEDGGERLQQLARDRSAAQIDHRNMTYATVNDRNFALADMYATHPDYAAAHHIPEYNVRRMIRYAQSHGHRTEEISNWVDSHRQVRQREIVHVDK